jgi:hypothetical protein
MENHLLICLLVKEQRLKEKSNTTDKVDEFEVTKNQNPQFITELITWVGKVMVAVGQSLQTVNQPSYRQTITNSKI